MALPAARLLAFALSLHLASCSLARDDAEALLARGRYPEAMARLRAEEPEESGLGEARRARYALLRGLAHLALGDLDATRRWLDEAHHHLVSDPSCLSPDDAARLRDARASLGLGW